MYDELKEIQNVNNQDVIDAVWEKAIVVEGYNKELYRHDFAGAWIARAAYGDVNSNFGWEIDHVYPVDKGGDNHFVNLRPMQWKNNRSKGNDYPRYFAVVVAENNENIEKKITCMVNSTLRAKLDELYKK